MVAAIRSSCDVDAWGFCAIIRPYAGIAQLVERNLAKVEVESSRLFSRSKISRGRFIPSPIHLSQQVCGSDGGLAKWLCSGLQIRRHRFDSGTRLQCYPRLVPRPTNPVKFGLHISRCQCPGGEIGRHKGLKIPRIRKKGVPVRFRSRAPEQHRAP